MSKTDSETETEGQKAPKLYEYDFFTCRTVTTGKFDKQDVIAAIRVTRGNLSKIGALLQKNRSQVKNYVDQNQDIQLLIADVREEVLDHIEDAAITVALQGDPAQQRFFLQTLGKDRGYTTKSTVDGKMSVDPSVSALFERVAAAGRRLVDKIENAPMIEGDVED